MEVFWNKQSQLITINAAIKHYKSTELASPTRSTVPLLSLLKEGKPLLISLLGSLKMPENSSLRLEYTAKPQYTDETKKGTGKVSCTDLMAISGKSSLAIEAKWTEKRYPTVDKWGKRGEKPANRDVVLSGWLELLQKHSARKVELKPADLTGAVYQMVHRAASACVAGNDPRMAYLVFSPDPNLQPSKTSQLQKDLEHLWELLGRPEGFPFYLVEVQISPTAAFDAIKYLPKKGPSTASQVRNSLLGSTPLFNFDKFCVTRVG